METENPKRAAKKIKRLNSKRWVWVSIVVLASFFLLFSIHGRILIEPNQYLMSKDGEAIRVHYVMAYHAKLDSSFTHFEGMNYPFGEHIIYCDAQPIVTNSFKALVHFFPALSNYAVGFQHILSFYGLILASVLYFFVFVRWGVAHWFAALSALAIMLMGPQILRMPWHPSLAYAFFFPVLLLLYQDVFRQFSWSNTLKATVWSFIFYFINPYIGVFSTLFFGLVWVFSFRRDKLKEAVFFVKGFIMVLLPGMLYKVWGDMTDQVSDRVEIPTGLHDFTATLGTLFTSDSNLMNGLYHRFGFEPSYYYLHFDGLAYLGFFTILILGFMLGRWIFSFFSDRIQPVLPKETYPLIPIILVFGLLSLGIPFIWHPAFEDLLSLFGPLRQLRALGRFSWVFSLGGMVLAMSFLFHFRETFESAKARKFLTVLSILGLVFLAIEGIGLHQQMASSQAEGNPFSLEQLKADPELKEIAQLVDSIDTDKYQVIVPLPFFHVGNELFVTASHTTYYAMRQVLSFAYHEQKPVTATYLSRISRRETEQAFRFFSFPGIEKDIRTSFNDQAILFFHSKIQTHLSEEEKRFLNLGTVIYSSDAIDLIEIQPSKIWETKGDEIHQWFLDHQSTYQNIENVFFKGPESPIYKAFEDGQGISFTGRGGFKQESKEKNYFFDQKQDAPNFKPGSYELSFWMETSSNRPQAILMQDVFDQSGQFLESIAHREANRSFNMLNDWARWQTEVILKPEYSVKFWMKAPSNEPDILMDDVLFKLPDQSVFIHRKEGKWFWNNYPYQSDLK